MRAALLLAACLVATLAFAGCASDSSPPAGASTRTVELQDDRFAPMDLEVKVGDTVKWTNTGQHQHNVRIHPNSGTAFLLDRDVAPGASAQFTFTQAGSFHTVCHIHEGKGMMMMVHVAA